MPTLLLVRHAIAEDPTDTKSDAERALTPEGIDKFKQAARGFARTVEDAPAPVNVVGEAFTVYKIGSGLDVSLPRRERKTEVRSQGSGVSKTLYS